MASFNLRRKALEISHALFRLAEQISEVHLRNELQMLNVQLIREESQSDFPRALQTLGLMESLVMYGEAVGQITYADSQIIYREIQYLRMALRNVSEQKPITLDLESIFSPLPDESGNETIGSIYPERSEVASPPAQNESLVKGKHNPDRLWAVTKRVAELGHAAIRDIIAVFPGVSERTLRYDLQKLCEQGVLERVGSGGPASYYRAREVAEV